MNTKTKLILCFACISLTLNAQNITMEFPAFAGKTYDFVIFQGSKAEKIMQDTIPKNGKFVLKIPKKYAPYTGMCRWLFTNSEQGGGIDMAIPGHDFSISCMSDKPDNTNIIFTGFDAVNELNRLNGLQKIIIDKFETMSKASKLYDKTHHLFAAFQNEKEAQAKAYHDFQEDLKKNPNFNARFLPIVNLIQGYAHRLSDDDNEKGLLFNAYITQKMSIEDLYVSGHWEGIIQSWVMYQANVVNDKDKFAQEFKLMNDKIKKPVQYTDLVGKIAFFLTQYGKDDYIDAIAKTVLESGKVTEYLGSMQVFLKSIVGMKAPDLVVTEHKGKVEDHNHITKTIQTNKLKSKYSLLVFYQSGCGPCEETLRGLEGNYSNLQAKGFRIISLSADTDEAVFQNTAKTFTWQDRYCNFDGMNGVNFRNYAVIGTPTLYVLDAKGTVLTKLATITALLDWVKKKD
jgi:thiol-disulfide isomerase/thioredoxin